MQIMNNQVSLFELEEKNNNFDEHNIVDYIDISYDDIKSNKKINVMSLFSGCGGLDLGFKGGFFYLNQYYGQNPYNIIWANEIISDAAKTYKSQIGNHIIVEDISKLKKENFPASEMVDVVIGGFPCQDFSLAGKRQGFKVERGRLYLEMKRVIEITTPKVFIAENVKNLLVMENGLIMKTIINDFKSCGYNVYFHLFHSANYGIPQNRERVIIYGIRKDCDKINIKLPKETHSKKNWITCFEAIDDLWDLLDSGKISNHSNKDYSKAKFYIGSKTQGNTRINRDKIAPTIRSEHHGNIEGHYRTNGDELDINNWRRLSVRECARIQSFPDNFNFPVSTSSAYKQIGNAVPPVLAWYIARALLKSF